MSRPASTLLLLTLLAGCAGHGDAQATATVDAAAAGTAAVGPQAAPPAATQAADAALARAIELAEAGADEGDTPAVRAHPAYVWVEYARLHRDLANVGGVAVERWLAEHENDAAGRRLRMDWLQELASRGDWERIVATWRPWIERPALRCAWLTARGNLQPDAQWMQDVRAEWLQPRARIPAACHGAIALWQERGGLDDATRWRRIEAAIDAGETLAIRNTARELPDTARAMAEAYASAISAANLPASARAWPKDARSRAAATAALVAMAKKSPDDAEAALGEFAPLLGLDAAQQGRVRYEIALQSAASYLPASAERLARVPAASYDDGLHMLRTREAMARRDWRGALAAIDAMPPTLAERAQWRYFKARLLELSGAEGAEALYRQAAREPEFHGFLAADRLRAPYPLCPWQPEAQPAVQREVAATPALQAALALYRIGRRDWALAEWNQALSGFDDARRRIAVALAQDSGWYDRAVFNLARDGRREELRLYTLRFPLAWREEIEREARRNGIDPVWVTAEIRAESLFDPQARSPANARGLMQVLPATGQAVATRNGIAWDGDDTLYQPARNIAIGSAYLREMLERWGDLPAAIAAYNAGPTPTTRWREQRPDFDPDLWIETISYRETREYVARVLAFSVLYDWRLHGDALRVGERIAGRQDGERVKFVCP
ncbi:transglycosylase SLT domain-containing protein [Luteimonas sp. e5]